MSKQPEGYSSQLEAIEAIPKAQFKALMDSFYKQLEALYKVIGEDMPEDLNPVDPFLQVDFFKNALRMDDIEELLQNPHRPYFIYIIRHAARLIKVYYVESDTTDPKSSHDKMRDIIDQLLKNRIIGAEHLNLIIGENNASNSTNGGHSYSASEVISNLKAWADKLDDGVTTSVGTSVVQVHDKVRDSLVTLPEPTEAELQAAEDLRPTLTPPAPTEKQTIQFSPAPPQQEGSDTTSPLGYAATVPVTAVDEHGNPVMPPEPSESDRPSAITMPPDVESIPPEAPLEPQVPDLQQSVMPRPTSLPPVRPKVEMDGLQVEYVDGEDLDNLKPFAKYVVIEVTRDNSTAVLEVVPALIGRITIGGHETNIIDFRYQDEKQEEKAKRPKSLMNDAKYEMEDFMAEITVDSDGNIAMRNLVFSSTLCLRDGDSDSSFPMENPAPLNNGQSVRVGHYILKIEERALTKQKFFESSEGMILQLAEIIFDVDRSDKEDDLEAHKGVLRIINDLSAHPQEQQKLVAYCRKIYAQKTAELVQRMEQWTADSPVYDSRVIEQLLLLITIKKVSGDVLAPLPYTRLDIQQQAAKRIQKYYGVSRKAFGFRARTALILASTAGILGGEVEDMQWQQHVAIQQRLELLKFIELGLVSEEEVCKTKNTPKAFHQDIPFMLEMREYLKGLLANPSVDEIIEGMQNWTQNKMENFFTDEEIEIFGLKTFKQFRTSRSMESPPDLATQKRVSRLPDPQPSTLSDLLKAMGVERARTYVSNIRTWIDALDYTSLYQQQEQMEFVRKLLESGVVRHSEIVRNIQDIQGAEKLVEEILQQAGSMIEEVDEQREKATLH